MLEKISSLLEISTKKYLYNCLVKSLTYLDILNYGKSVFVIWFRLFCLMRVGGLMYKSFFLLTKQTKVCYELFQNFHLNSSATVDIHF